MLSVLDFPPVALPTFISTIRPSDYLSVSYTHLPSGVYSINELRDMGKSAAEDASCPDAEAIATIIFTSGTTGKSKGVMLTQNKLASNVEAVKILSLIHI